MLYTRGYRVLTPEEEKQFCIANEYVSKKKNGLTIFQMHRYHDLMPEAAYYYQSLFPNNFLSTTELENHEKLDNASARLREILDSEAAERSILNFVNHNAYYFLIGSILKSNYLFGHHEAFAFKEFELPPNFVTDYLLVGKNSSGYHFVFVELESPCGSIVNSDGTFGMTIRNGLKQIEDWDTWIDGNFSHLKLLFEKYLNSQRSLPGEFSTLDKTRIHYAIVAGRRSDFTEKTYRLQRKLKRERNITLLHYDNILDAVESFKRDANY